jgi:DNA-binding transcriptional MocR family regulator
MSSQEPTLEATAISGNGTTRYGQVALRIERLVEQGTLRPGERVPSVRQCSEQHDVSLATVTHAYRLLEDRGIIEARPQSGYYVRVRRWTPPPEPAKSTPSAKARTVCVNDLVLELIKAGREPGVVRLGATLPSPEFFPLKELNRVTAAVGRRSPLAANSYDAPEGNHALRVQVARRAMEAGCALGPDDIISTVGATEAINLCLRAVAQPGDVIAIESPTFFGILQMIKSLGLRVCEIPTYPREGICLDELKKRLRCCRIKACVFTLNFSNPLGSCMPDAKKQMLVNLLREHQVPLIEDDLYGNLAFGPARPKTAKAFDEAGWVMLCDSFTKTLSPGYRVGWVAPGRFKERVQFLKYVNTSATPSLPQMAIAEFVQNGGYDHHLRKIRRLYGQQMEKMLEAIGRHFPEGTKATRPTGGMCLWLELPGGVDALAVYRQALAEKISIAPGPLFSATLGYRNFIRLNCGNPWTDEIEDAVQRLGIMIRTQQSQPMPGPALCQPPGEKPRPEGARTGQLRRSSRRGTVQPRSPRHIRTRRQ